MGMGRAPVRQTGKKPMRSYGVLLMAAGCLAAGAAHAATLTLLSTGAVEPGILIAARHFRATGHEIDITFETAPQVAKRLAAGETWDLAIATPATIEQYTGTGLLASGSVTLGRVGVGIAVREGTIAPDVSSAESLKEAALAADSIIMSRGSTGIYAEGLLRKLGVYDQVEAKVVRTDRGAEAMARLAAGKGRDLALGALTEIAEHRNNGVVLAAPLPEELQNYTTYVIARMNNSPHEEVATAFLAYLALPASRAAFRKAGIGQ